MKQSKNSSIKIVSILSVLLFLVSYVALKDSPVQKVQSPELEASQIIEGPVEKVQKSPVEVVKRSVIQKKVKAKEVIKVSQKVVEEDIKEDSKEEVKTVSVASPVAEETLPSYKLQKSYLRLKRGFRFSFGYSDEPLLDKSWRTSSALVSVRLLK